MSPKQVEAFIRKHQIRSITMFPEYIGGFVISLKCGGAGGYGETVEAAFADAKAKNAEWLEEAA